LRDERNGQHPLSGVEAQRVMRGASVAQPKVFPPPKLAPTSIERGVGVGREGFRQKELAFA